MPCRAGRFTTVEPRSHRLIIMPRLSVLHLLIFGQLMGSRSVETLAFFYKEVEQLPLPLSVKPGQCLSARKRLWVKLKDVVLVLECSKRVEGGKIVQSLPCRAEQ